MKSIKKIYALCLVIGLGLFSCSEEFLNRPPEDRLAVDNFYKSAKDLRLATAPLYNAVWYDFHKRAIVPMGEARSGNIKATWMYGAWEVFTLTSLDFDLNDAWTSLHNVIGQSNIIMQAIKKNATGVTDEQKNAALAEARFMRATAYFYLVRAWGPVIIIENNEELLKNPLVRTNRVEDVYQFIINDLEFASEHLPKTDDPGRVTQWSAKGLLAKVYLARSGYNNGNTRLQSDLDKSMQFASDVYDNSGLTLLESYPDLFRYQYKNNAESLFSLQWVPNGGWLVGNSLVSDLAHSRDVLGGANGWSSTIASYDMIKSYEPGDTIRRNATWMTAGTHYAYINGAEGGYTFPANDTVRATIKKYVPGGTADNDGAIVGMQNSPLTTYMLRLSDVYLTYAEAALGNNTTLSSGPGLTAFNEVRKRAGMPEKTSITFEDIVYERRIELAMEYQFWYDMVAWHYFKPDYIIDMINNQKRGSTYTYHKDENHNLVVSIDYEGNSVNVSNSDMRFPYPEREVVQNPLLKEEPVAYYND
jgi:starch-binding outer membrane protein, SusD/RagB family